ncbi:Zinc finger MYM-type protein 1 [Amphibalanus amphitrite]|uniref:Zinc finger MYM-type protein 1 n=1 Tax=Amphibalanus amphitrite TaxID=1232801 RepID=A0A6A4WSV2_AMPAM|nr:Zinc finger MYM-type protein 1 [Amphibalanus amphitrite]
MDITKYFKKQPKPNQPRDAATLAKTARSQGGRSRTVCPEWYKKYSWLSVCSTGKVFCHTCVAMARQGKLTMSKSKEAAFVSDGFSNWKKAMAAFQQHEASLTHREACTKKAAEKTEPISARLVTQTAAQHAKRRMCLKKEIESLIFLLRQNLPIRGKKEEEGNLHQLLALRQRDVPDLRTWESYNSPVVQNELIRAIGHSLLRGLLTDIRAASFFAVMADETTDAAREEQLSLSIRWVDSDLIIHEDPVEFIQVAETTGDALAAALKDALLRMQLPLAACRGQAYDGAANMQGRLRGVATRLQQECPSALHVHCLAHCVNLVLQEASRQQKIVRDALDVANSATTFVRNSPKTTEVLRVMAQQAGSAGTSLRPLCPTRWTCRTACLQSVLGNYTALLDTFEKVNSSASDDHSQRAGGIKAVMEKFGTVLGLHISVAVFSVAEGLSRGLQSATATAQQATQAAQRVRLQFRRMRTEEEFDAIYQAAKAMADDEDRVEEPTLPRKRKVPKRLGGGGEHHDADPTAFYRRQFFELLDLLDTQLEERFNQPSMNKVAEVERLLEDAAAGKTCAVPDAVKELHGRDVDVKRLEVQLKMLPDIMSQATSDASVAETSNSSVISVHSVCQALQKAKTTGGEVFCLMMNEVLTLMRLYLTLPVTTATSERSFSTLRRTKTFLRTTMGQARLNAALLATIHRHRTDQLDVDAILDEFVSANERRRLFFGKQ